MMKSVFHGVLSPFQTIANSMRKKGKTFASRKKLNEKLALAMELEKQLEADAESISLREKLIECYHTAMVHAVFKSPQQSEIAGQHAAHVLWYVQHAPQNTFAGSPCTFWPMWSAENTEKVHCAWMSQIEKFPHDAWILHNAASFSIFRDLEKAKALAAKAHNLAPENFEVSSRLAQLLCLKAIGSDPEQKLRLINEALQLREQAMELMPDERRREELRDVAQNAFDIGNYVKARKYAEELFELARNNYWDAANVFYQGHIILGRIALKNGELEEAKSRLLKAGNPPMGLEIIPCRFDLHSELVQDLLDRNEKEVVQCYFDDCKKYKSKLPDKWK